MSVLEAAIGWLAPPHCIGCGGEGSALCADCAQANITPFDERCWNCNALSALGRTCPSCRHLGGPRYVWINTNYETTAADLIRVYKFGHLRAAAGPISNLMAQTVLSFHSAESLQALDYLVAPVPTATSRVRQRGFDHSDMLARQLARKLGLRKANLLGRSGQTRQLGAPKAQRLAQAAGKYFVRNTSSVAGQNILLVDDVITTGGTIIAATKALRAAGAARVDALIFAKKL